MDKTKSIEQLEDDYWDDPDFESVLVNNCHAFRKIPVCELTPYQVRTLLGQKIGIPFLQEVAIEFVEKDILEDGDMYPGHTLEKEVEIDKFIDEQQSSDRLLEALYAQKDRYLTEFDEHKFNALILKIKGKTQY